jgi:hypothetical protein
MLQYSAGYFVAHFALDIHHQKIGLCWNSQIVDVLTVKHTLGKHHTLGKITAIWQKTYKTLGKLEKYITQNSIHDKPMDTLPLRA